MGEPRAQTEQPDRAAAPPGEAEPSVASSKPLPNARALPSPWDALFVVAALVFSLPSLLYPFGRDQGLYYYVGREWLLRGSIPYRDVLDHKPPGIYVIHALAIAVFGEKEWAIRVFEIAAVLVFGWIAGACVGRGEAPVRAGYRGAGALLFAVFYFGFFDYWNSAQTELWYSGFGVVAVWAVRRCRRVSVAAFVAGLFSGLVLVTKPPGIGFALVAGVLLAFRLRREGASKRDVARTAGALVAGGALAPALVLVYFGAHGALFAMRDIVVGANAYYVEHEGGPPGTVLHHVGYIASYYAPFTPLFVFGPLFGLWRGMRERDADDPRKSPKGEAIERNVLALALLGAGFLGVAMQGKWYLLHWGAILLPFAYALLVTLEATTASLSDRARMALVAVAVPLGYAVTAPVGGAATMQKDVIAGDYAYLTGKEDVRAFLSRYRNDYMGYYYVDSYDAGKWLEAHSSKDDVVCVRGFEPQIYAVANRRFVGRFFWTTFLTQPARAYRRAEWLAEDARALAANPPAFIVTLSAIHEGLDSREHYEPLGYRSVAIFHGYEILARADR